MLRLGRGCFCLSPAFGLEGLELVQRLFEGAVETLFVEAKVREGLRVVAEDAAGGKGGMDLGMSGLDFAGGFGVAKRDHGVFDGPGSVETPLGIAEGLGVLALERSFRREVLDQLVAEGVVRLQVLPGHNDGASGEPVAHGVQRGFSFAFFAYFAFVGARTGGVRFWLRGCCR
jgi:hypothetical protein